MYVYFFIAAIVFISKLFVSKAYLRGHLYSFMSFIVSPNVQSIIGGGGVLCAFQNKQKVNKLSFNSCHFKVNCNIA